MYTDVSRVVYISRQAEIKFCLLTFINTDVSQVVFFYAYRC
jgi:hypothetical protein